jgi:hypothetical protein
MMNGADRPSCSSVPAFPLERANITIRSRHSGIEGAASAGLQPRASRSSCSTSSDVELFGVPFLPSYVEPTCHLARKYRLDSGRLRDSLIQRHADRLALDNRHRHASNSAARASSRRESSARSAQHRCAASLRCRLTSAHQRTPARPRLTVLGTQCNRKRSPGAVPRRLEQGLSLCRQRSRTPPPSLEVATSRARRAIETGRALKSTLVSVISPRKPSTPQPPAPLEPLLTPRALRARANFCRAREAIGLGHRVDPVQIQHRVIYTWEDADRHNLVHGAARRAGHLEQEAARIRTHLPPLLRDVFAVRRRHHGFLRGYCISCPAAHHEQMMHAVQAADTGEHRALCDTQQVYAATCEQKELKHPDANFKMSHV